MARAQQVRAQHTSGSRQQPVDNAPPPLSDEDGVATTTQTTVEEAATVRARAA